MSIKPDCIIAAAGRSSRMNRWKPGLPWTAGDTILQVVVRKALAAGCRVIVIGGYRFRSLKTLLKMFEADDVTVVRAKHWRRGMGASLRRGLLEVSSDRYFIVAGDMPLVDAEDYRRLDSLFDGSVLRPEWRGRPGHPVLLPIDSLDGILSDGLQSGRAFRDTLASKDVRLVPWDHDGIVADIDTPEAYDERRPEA